jgi:hypothetical protein
MTALRDAERELSNEPPHRKQARASAYVAWQAAEQLWADSSDVEVQRQSSAPTMWLLYRQCARLSLQALTRDGQPARWSDAAVRHAEAPAAAQAAFLDDLLVEKAVPSPLTDEALRLERWRADTLLRSASEVVARVATLRTWRLMALIVLGALALVSAGAGIALVQRITTPIDLAAGHPWSASSKQLDCNPDAELCGGVKTRSFFFTKEEDQPWYKIDLEAPKQISSVTIVNRQDNVLDRAVPLVVELSDDGNTWRQVARRDEVFSTWRARFSTQTARWVRLRVDKRSTFHLEAVRVHP